jgi:hypothetical protein
VKRRELIQALGAGGRSLKPTAEFKRPLGTVAITAPAAWSPGAFQ